MSHLSYGVVSTLENVSNVKIGTSLQCCRMVVRSVNETRLRWLRSSEGPRGTILGRENGPRRRVSQILLDATIYLRSALPRLPPTCVGMPPTLTLASSFSGHAWGCSGEDYPFHPQQRRPRGRAPRVIVSVALAIGYPTPAYAGHPALRCLDFPLPES